MKHFDTMLSLLFYDSLVNIHTSLKQTESEIIMNLDNFKSEYIVYNETIDLETTSDGFEIKFEAEPEHGTIDDLLNGCEQSLIDTTIKAVESGKLVCFSAKIFVEKNGIELGCANLGVCFHDTVKSFLESGYYPQMKEEALEEAKQAIIDLVK